MTDGFKISTTERFGDAPYFVFCDHASNCIPPELDNLGLPDDLLETHIAWDIGAGAVTKALAEKLLGAALTCNLSRLVIDVNRAETAYDLIPASSDQIPIPGNQMMSEGDRQSRVENFYRPYHRALSGTVAKVVEDHECPFVISVHSFTRRLMGARRDRPWPVGLLWREDETSAKKIIRFLKDRSGWPIGDNEPYDAREFNYSIDTHVGPRGIRHLTFEIRQDMVCNDEAVSEIAQLLSDGVKFAAETPEQPGRSGDGG